MRLDGEEGGERGDRGERGFGGEGRRRWRRGGCFGVRGRVDRIAGEGVGDILRTGAVGDGDVALEGGEELGPASLATRQVLLGEEALQRVVVSAQREEAAFKVAAELLACVDDGEQLELVDGVVGFVLVELAGFEGYGVESAVTVL